MGSVCSSHHGLLTFSLISFNLDGFSSTSLWVRLWSESRVTTVMQLRKQQDSCAPRHGYRLLLRLNKASQHNRPTAFPMNASPVFTIAVLRNPAVEPALCVWKRVYSQVKISFSPNLCVGSEFVLTSGVFWAPGRTEVKTSALLPLNRWQRLDFKIDTRRVCFYRSTMLFKGRGSSGKHGASKDKAGR